MSSSNLPIEMKKILIINLGGIGDVLLSTPTLRALRKFYPQTEVSILIAPRVYEIVKNLSYINEVLVFHVGYGGTIPFTKIFGNLKTLFVLRNKQFDLAINMRTLVSKKSALKIKFLLGIINPKMKAGRDTEGWGYFFDVKVPEPEIGEKYEMDYDIETLELLGVNVGDRSIDFEIDEASKERVNQLLLKEGVTEDDILIGIHPGGMASRRWPIENFSRVIKEINKKTKCKFVITGGKEESFLVNELMKMTDLKMINVVGKINIKELGALIKRCNLYISNDTGPIHIAAILKIPLIAIFGSSEITRYDPRNISEKATVFYKKVDCSPCYNVNCKSMKCMKAILPEEVIEASLKCLQKYITGSTD